MPDLCQQDDLARYAPADQCQPYEHEAHEADRLAPEREEEDQPQHEGQAAHREHQPHPPAAFLHRVAAPCLACDTGHQRDERRADTGDAEHDASRHDMRRERSQREEQDAPHPCPGGYGRHDEDQQRTLPAGEACGVDREGAVTRVLGDQAETRRGGGRRRDARRDEPQPADDMPRDERPGHVRLDDEKPADDRHGGDRIADGREKVFRGGGIGADDLADDGSGNDFVTSVREYAASEGSEVFVICAQIEQEIAELDDDEKAMFLEDLGLKESGLEKLIAASYKLLGLISYLTSGEDETRAWTITKGTKAPQAAGKIHTDFERGFIRAEVVSYDHLIECGSMTAAKEKGLVRLEGKDYVVQDGDIILFRFNV